VTLDRQRPVVMERVKEFAERLTARLAKLRSEEAVVAAAEAPQQSKGRSENRGATT
jgi:carboxylesterase